MSKKATYLEGTTLQWYKTNFSAHNTYAQIVGNLKEQFPSQIDYAQQFYYKRQLPNEPLITYFYSLNNLAMRAKIQDDRFIKQYYRGT